MIVSILQLMGFPVAKPVHSRAEEPPSKKPAKGHSGTKSPTDHAQERSARRQEVKAKTGKDSKAAATKNKVSVPAKPKGKTVANPLAKVPAKPAVKKAVSVKLAPKAAPKSAAKPVSKPVLKPGSKPAPKPVAKATPAKVKKPAAKVAAKTVAKPATPVKKVAVKAPTPSAKTAVKVVSQPISKPRAPVSPAPMPVSTKSAKPIAVPVPSKSKVAVVAPPVAEKAVAAVVAAVPAKAGRPSSRLAQLTVPSIAQSVASTAAKASYTQSTPSPLIVPALPSSIKKDAKLANNWKTTPAADLTDAELMAMPDAEYMNAVQMAAFRAKLIKLKLDILNSAGETTEHLREDTSVVPDPADRATIEEEHALELRTRDRERKLLKKIEQSIGRIDAGDYGYCDETGEAIGVGRLLARPTATLSLEAQQRRELKQKMFGD
jgi:DnaK suppressor protein